MIDFLARDYNHSLTHVLHVLGELIFLYTNAYTLSKMDE